MFNPLIFIFLLLLPISTTAHANDTSLPFRSIAIEAQFYDVLIQHPEFMKEGGAKVFAMKNDPNRALREMADIEYLLRLPEIEMEEAKKYFEKYGQMDRYYDIIGGKGKEQGS